jgi:hypothetical protein
MRRLVPDEVRENSQTWPLVLAFAVLMEKQLEANRHKDRANGTRAWLKDDPSGLMRHLVEEVEEIDTAVAAYVHGAVTNDRLRGARIVQVRREGADVGNLAMMVVDRVTSLQPIRDWPLDEDVQTDPLKAPPSHDANVGGRSASEACYVSCQGRDLAIIAQRVGRVFSDLTANWTLTPETSETFNDLQAALVKVERLIQARATEICPQAASEAQDAFDWARQVGS